MFLGIKSDFWKMHHKWVYAYNNNKYLSMEFFFELFCFLTSLMVIFSNFKHKLTSFV